MKTSNFSKIVKKIEDVESYRNDLKKILIALKEIKTEDQKCCIFCGSKKNEIFFKYIHIEYKLCNNCKSIFLFKRPNEQSLNLFYKKLFLNKHFINDLPLKKKTLRVTNLMKPRWNTIKDLLKKYNKNSIKNFLEIGPGIGYFSELAVNDKLSKKYDLVEPDKKACLYLKKIFKNNNNIYIHNCLFENFNQSTLYDLIFINSVIEHPLNIKKFFKKISSHLDKNGYFILTDMNSEGVDVNILKERTPNYNPYTILQVASKKGIKHLCKINKLELLECISIGDMDIDIIYEYDGFYNKSSKKSYLMKLFDSPKIRSIFQESLKKNGMTGYNLYLIKKIA